MKNIEKRLVDKSIEAFTLAIEVYNKPTIKYRVEGFAFFICNAWELMLKAKLLNDKENIYYTDKKERTISLSECLKKVFTNAKDPLRLNIEKINELRSASTHFITEDYEMVYVPLFQACIINFNEKMMLFHNIDMTNYVPQNFLTLSVSMKALDEAEIIAKYPEEIAQKLINTKTDIDDLSQNNNSNFAIKIEHYHYLTKDKNKATSFIKVDNNAEAPVKIIKELKDPNNTHKFTTKKCIELIKDSLNRTDTTLLYNGNPTKFNSFHFTNFCNYYGMKTNTKYCYIHKQFKQPQYSYSMQAVEFIISELEKDPNNILDNIKKRSTPGAKEF